MYKIASDKKQTILHRGRVKDWLASGDGTLQAATGEALVKQLKDETRILQNRIATCADLRERKALGLQMFEVQSRINELRKNGIGRPRAEIERAFFKEAKRILPSHMFDIVYSAALKRRDEDPNAHK